MIDSIFELIDQGRKQFAELSLQEGDNFPSLVYTRDQIESIIVKTKNLTGLKISPNVDVKGLSFFRVKMDQTVLKFLVEMGANVCGVDISKQIINGMDLTDIDLTGADTDGTKFFSTKLVRTNLTNVDLKNTIFDENTIASIDSVIVADEDRLPYLAELQRKLIFILIKGKEIVRNGDPFYASGEEDLDHFYQQIMFPLDDECLQFGRGIQGGSQDICLEGSMLDQRLINMDGLSPELVKQHQQFAENKLFRENGFTLSQKALFHHMRAAMWTLLKLDLYIHMKMQDWDGMTDSHFQEKLTRIKALLQIYVYGSKNEHRVHPLLKEMCYTVILPVVEEKYQNLEKNQAEEVYELFASSHYCW